MNPGATRGETILVVEDEPDLQRLVAMYLQNAGYHVVCASNGREALRKAAEIPIALVILDLMLPDIDGVVVCQELRRRPETLHVPVMVLSAISQVDDKVRALEAGADEYVTKPMHMKELLARVNALIARTQRLMAAQPSPQGRVFGIIGAKGGVGVTTIVLNVGSLLAQRGKRTIALELHPDFGAFSLYLKLTPAENLTHLLKLEPERLDKRALGTRLYTTGVGLQVLFGPQQVAEYGPLDPARTTSVVKQAASLAEFILLDLPTIPSGATEAALRLCDFVLLVTEPEPISVGSAKLLLQLLDQWGISRAQVRAVVVNRSGLSIALTLREVNTLLGCEIIGVMPFAGEACVAALAQGVPLALHKPDHTAAVTLKEMANRLMADVVVGLRL